MQVLIIEDEFHAVKYLSGLLQEIEPDIEILTNLDTVRDSVQWLQNNAAPDLIFMDIQLADGLSFDIFRQIEVPAPVIFTTAFDQYTLRAFKINSIDYLLKPIEEEELAAALKKFKQYHQPQAQQGLQELVASLQLQQKAFRQRFLIKQGKNWGYLPVSEIAYIYSDEGITFAMDQQGKRFVLESTLDRIQDELDPRNFYRINRAQIIHISAISSINNWFNHRLKLDIRPDNKELESIVSRDRVKGFKAWLDR